MVILLERESKKRKINENWYQNVRWPRWPLRQLSHGLCHAVDFDEFKLMVTLHVQWFVVAWFVERVSAVALGFKTNILSVSISDPESGYSGWCHFKLIIPLHLTRHDFLYWCIQQISLLCIMIPFPETTSYENLLFFLNQNWPLYQQCWPLSHIWPTILTHICTSYAGDIGANSWVFDNTCSKDV